MKQVAEVYCARLRRFGENKVGVRNIISKVEYEKITDYYDLTKTFQIELTPRSSYVIMIHIVINIGSQR